MAAVVVGQEDAAMLATLIELHAAQLNPGVRLDIAVRDCPDLVQWATVHDDSDWVLREAARLRISVGTFVIKVLGLDRCGYGGPWSEAFRLIYGVLSAPSQLHAAILAGEYERGLEILAEHPSHARWKFRGMLPVHALSVRGGAPNDSSGDGADVSTVSPGLLGAEHIEETGDYIVLAPSSQRPRARLLQALLKVDPTAALTRADANWSLGVANGLNPLQLAVLPLPGAAVTPALDLELITILLDACPAAGADEATKFARGVPEGDTVRSILRTELDGEGYAYSPWRLRVLTQLEELDLAGSGDDIGGEQEFGAQPKYDNAPSPAHGADMLPDEFQSRISEDDTCTLIASRFFNEFSSDEQHHLFYLSALVRGHDCLNTPSRLMAERQVAIAGESLLESVLSKLRLQYVTEEQQQHNAAQLQRKLRFTPDVFFPEDVRLPGTPQSVRWVDSKNGWFIPGLSLESKLVSLRRQVLKYSHFVGPGLVLWHKGYFETILDITPSIITHAVLNSEGDIVECRVGRGEYTVRTMRVQRRMTGLLIGKAGETVRWVEEQFHVLLIVPTLEELAQDSGDRCVVSIAGCSKGDVDAAVCYIRDYVLVSGKRRHGSLPRQSTGGMAKIGSLVPPQLASAEYRPKSASPVGERKC